MSIIRCIHCSKPIDTDQTDPIIFDGYQLIFDGEELCLDCASKWARNQRPESEAESEAEEYRAHRAYAKNMEAKE